MSLQPALLPHQRHASRPDMAPAGGGSGVGTRVVAAIGCELGRLARDWQRWVGGRLAGHSIDNPSDALPAVLRAQAHAHRRSHQPTFTQQACGRVGAWGAALLACSCSCQHGRASLSSGA